MSENLQQQASDPMAESENCKLFGTIILVLSIALGVVYIMAFGKVESIRYSEYAGAIEESSWSLGQIILGLSIAASGIVWWYLFQKIGSVLKHLESK